MTAITVTTILTTTTIEPSPQLPPLSPPSPSNQHNLLPLTAAAIIIRVTTNTTMYRFVTTFTRFRG